MTAASTDLVLRQFHATAPTYGGGMSNHGPMVVEALEAAGLAEHAPAFAKHALATLEPLPDAGQGVLALGDAHEAEWIEHYRARIETTSVEDVVRDALPTLLPGAMAGATHGLIRLSHAMRGWVRAPSEVRAEEVAHGLGYWASAFQALPGEVGTAPSLDLHTVMARLPGLAAEERSRAGMIFDRVRALDGVPRFVDAIATLDVREQSTSDFISQMVGIAARMMLTSRGAGFAYLHGITATSAVRSLLPFVDASSELAVRHAVFHCVAALHAAHGGSKAWLEWAPPVALPDVRTLPLDAVRSQGDHGIKLAVAVADEVLQRPDPALLCAAEAEINRSRG
ncbi:MAG: DUF4243 domain-containing protein [Nannocystaceae bacterium]|nr:DUF4243 domain-containing protein [Nannocystaceae bacterium]